MMMPTAGPANRVIERILELSADAHILRRGTAKNSPEFHKLTEVIGACGKALALLTALREREKPYAKISQSEMPTSAAVAG